MSAAWPAVAQWLVTTLPALSGWGGDTVFDGQPDTGDSPTDYATVGYTASGDVGGEFTEVTSDDGEFIVEQGHVFLDVVCQSGDSPPVDTLAQVRTRCELQRGRRLRREQRRKRNQRATANYPFLPILA